MKIYLATGNLNKKREIQQVLPDFEVVIPKDEGIVFDPEETGTNFYENSMIKAHELWKIVHAPVIADDSGICVDVLGGAPGVWSARYAGPDFMHGRPDGGHAPQEEQNRLLIEQTTAAIMAARTTKSKPEMDSLPPQRQQSCAQSLHDQPQGSAGSTTVHDQPPQALHLFANGPRSCHYSCSMVLFLSPDRFFIAQETMEGSIIERIEDARGEGGFGYDPIVFLPQFGKTVAEISAEQKNAISHRGKATRVIMDIIKRVL